MGKVRANGIELEVEIDGPDDGVPLVLVMGIGAQLVHWPRSFVADLADVGFRVIRFDNRDVGLSEKIHDAGVPPALPAMARRLAGLTVEAPYTFHDMANDTVGVLDALGLEDAHVMGVSLGGMVAQTMALDHPERMRSLVSVMSTPGDRRSSLGEPKAIKALLSKPPRDRGEAMDNMVAFYDVVAGRGFPIDREEIRLRAGLAWDRCHYPAGFARQFAAMLASGSRRPRLPGLSVPTLVIHGTDDPLIPPRAGLATARLIPGARLHLIRGMGHSIPRGVRPMIAKSVWAHAMAAEAPRRVWRGPTATTQLAG